MNNYRLLISYDGTEYSGWQVQPNGISIQQLLQDTASIILRQPIQITGSGRTDAGVHATGQVAHFFSNTPIDTFRFLGSMNGLLPPDIRIHDIYAVSDHFHARYSAVKKAYSYHFCLDRVQLPFDRLYRLHIREKINLNALVEAAAIFVGTHDFSAFANEQHRGVAAKDAVRTVERLVINNEEGGIRLDIEADGFLYKMVRNIVGTLLEVGNGKIAVDDIPLILDHKDRRRAGHTAPPHGLFLRKVCYPSAFDHNPDLYP